MMQDKAILTLGSWSFGRGWSFGVACALSAACAGGDTPPRDDALEDLVAQAYGRGQQTAQAGSTGMGTGGSGSGTGGSGSGNGGSTSEVVPGTGGSDSGSGGTASGGSAGTGVAAGGSAGTGSTAGACNGFAILQAKCNGGSCHGDGTTFSDFAASEAAAEGFSGQASAICGSQDNSPLFDPDNPGASLVLKKIAGTSACGNPMPLGSQPDSLPDADIECLEEWIETL